LGDKGLIIAIEGKDREEIWKALCLKQIDKTNSRFFEEQVIGGAYYSGNWYLLSLGHRPSLSLRLVEERLRLMPLDMEAIVHEFYENVNFSSTQSWLNGKKRWSVSHTLDKGRDNLEVRGPVPEILTNIHEKAKAELSVDEHDIFFDVPVDLMEQITGFRYGASGSVFPSEGDHLVPQDPSLYNKNNKRMHAGADGRVAQRTVDGKRVHIFCLLNKFSASYEDGRWTVGTKFYNGDLRENFILVEDPVEMYRLFAEAERYLSDS
jgi:hypothetical protein